MRVYLHAVFNDPIGVDLCREIASLGFDGIRIDAQHATDAVLVEMVSQARVAGLSCLVIIRDGAQLQAALEALGTDPAVEWELRNEPDIEGPNPAAYCALMQDAADVANAKGVWLYVGVVSNPHDRGRKYMDALRSTLATLPPCVGVTWHRYPAGGYSESFARPHDGYGAREDEVAKMGALAGHRPFGISEAGYHTALRTTGWWLWRRSRRWTDDGVASLFAQEVQFWDAAGADFLVWYQLNDGPTDARLDRYGLRRIDGSWKPAASVLLPREAA